MNQYKNRKFDFCEKKLLLNIDDEEIQDPIIDCACDYYDCYYYEQKYYQHLRTLVDFSIPICNYQNGNAWIFLLTKRSSQYLDNFKFKEIKDLNLFQTEKLDKPVQDLKKLNNIERLNIFIDFQALIISEIQELPINQFDLQNLLKIQLYIFMDEFHLQKTIEFVQSVLNLQTLEYLELVIIPKFRADVAEYVQYFKNQLESQSNLKCLEITVKSYQKSAAVEVKKIFSDEGNINELVLSNIVSIELNAQQAKSIKNLKIEFNNSEKQYLIQLNRFLKKLINLQYLKVGYHQFVEENEEQRVQQIELLQTIIPQLKQIQILRLDFPIKIENADKEKQLRLQSYNIQDLKICLGDSIIPIHCPNLHDLDLTYYCKKEQLDQELFVRTLSSIKHLKILKVKIYILHNDWYNVFHERHFQSKSLESKIKRKLLKNLKRLVCLNVDIKASHY